MAGLPVIASPKKNRRNAIPQPVFVQQNGCMLVAANFFKIPD